MRRISFLLLVTALVASVLTAVPVGAQTTSGSGYYIANLAGSAEVPPVTTDASGVAAFRLRTSGLDFSVITHGLEDVVAAHIHLGSPSENGPVVATLFGPVEGGVTRDGVLARGFGVLGAGEILSVNGFDGTLSSLVERIQDGTAYVNVHTMANPGGEIRGTITGLDVVDAFDDDDGNVHEQNIDVLGAAGITKGCNPPDNTEYCPDDSVTRGQMAAFMRRAFNLPPATTDFFGDDDESIFEGDINAIAAYGITKGCNPPDNDEFCPDDDVTRGEMASFLVRALGLVEGAGLDVFEDDDGTTHEDDIDRLAMAGITKGCNPPDNTAFCPANDIRRSEMASFMSRTMGWESILPPVSFTLTVLHNNDGESDLLTGDDGFGGAAVFKALVDQERAGSSTDGLLMLSSGDNFLAGPEFSASLDKGVPFYDTLVMEAVGYDGVAIGNHDFDFGPDVLADFIAGYTDPPPYLSANLDFVAEPNLQALVTAGTIAPSTMVEIGGNKIGIVGATTPNLRFISSPRNVAVDPNVTGAIQAQVNQLKADGAGIVILISHLQSINEDLQLAPNLSGVDIMIAGGGDELLASPGDPLIPGDETEVFGAYPLHAIGKDGRVIPVVTTSGQYRYLGKLVVSFNPAGQLVGVSNGPSMPVRVSTVGSDAVTPDPTIVSTVIEPVEAYVADLDTQIATSEVDLNGVRGDVRTIETNQGDLIADALLWQASELAAGFGAPAPDVALQNGGGIRNDSVVPAGPITELDTFDMLPFPNFVTIIPGITRDQFKEILENAVSNVENVDGRFAQVAGFSFTWDADGTAQVLDEDGNVTTAGTRVTEVTLDDTTQIVTGGAVVAGDDLVIATIDFLARGGDQYPYRGAPFTSVGVSYQQALSNYIQTALTGTIAAADYPVGGEGRITRLN